CVFFCRNNGWAISVPTERQTGSATFAEKGIAYGIPGMRVDGNDIFAVIQGTRGALLRAPRRAGATLISDPPARDPAGARGVDAHRGAHVPPVRPLDERRSEGLPPRRDARCVA